MTAPSIPERIHRAGPEVVITWAADHVGQYPARMLRLACHCAMCREEMSGRPLLDPATVPLDIAADIISLVGSYGIKIRWSDGHDTGIYTYEYLLALCPCAQCAVARNEEGRGETRREGK